MRGILLYLLKVTLVVLMHGMTAILAFSISQVCIAAVELNVLSLPLELYVYTGVQCALVMCLCMGNNFSVCVFWCILSG